MVKRGMPSSSATRRELVGTVGADDLNEGQGLTMGIQDGEVRAASAADRGGLLLLHHCESGTPQQVVAVRVHPLARPQDMLGRLAVPPAMSGGVTLPALLRTRMRRTRPACGPDGRRGPASTVRAVATAFVDYLTSGCICPSRPAARPPSEVVRFSR